jgi:flagellar biosynthetic protein FliQ
MDMTVVLDISRNALLQTLIISGPLLLVGLVVGVVVGIFQAVTQIHEMTLTFIPKILATALVFLAMLPWIVTKLVEYTVSLFSMIPTIVH